MRPRFFIIFTIISVGIPLSLILILAAVAIYLKRRQARDIRNKARPTRQLAIPTDTIVGILLAVYLLAYLLLTLVRSPMAEPDVELMPFWSYRAAFRTNPFRIRDPRLALQILYNILLMIPIGLLLPLVYHKTRHPVRLTFLTAAALSIATEVIQYFARLGTCETDDVMHNLLGCGIGIAIMLLGDRLNLRRRKQK